MNLAARKSTCSLVFASQLEGLTAQTLKATAVIDVKAGRLLAVV